MHAPPWGILRELAAGTAATLLFFLSILIVPVVGILAGLFTPLPTLLAFYRWGLPMGLWIPGAAAAAGSLLLWHFGMAASIPYLIEMLIMGLFAGMAMRRNWSIEKTIGSAALLVFGMGALIFWAAYAGMDGAAVLRSMESELGQAITALLAQYGKSSPDAQLFDEALQQMIPTLVRLLPAAALASGLLAAWLNVLMTIRYCRVRHLPLPAWEELSRWKAPEPLVWLVIAGGAALLVPNAWAQIAGLNVLMVLGTIYLFQGLSVTTFYFERWHVPRMLRAVLYGFLLLQQFATLGAMLMGLFDMWFDFRRLTGKPESSA